MKRTILAAALLCLLVVGLAHAQFGPRTPPGAQQFRAPTIVTADELHLRGPGGLWKVTVGPRGALFATPVTQRPQGWQGGKRW